MKKVILAAVLALGLLAASGGKAKADGCGSRGPWGIGPGYFSINLGLSIQHSGLQFGHFQQQGGMYNNGNCGGGPCYGPPAMYNAYGQGQGHGHGHGYVKPAMYDAYGYGYQGGYGGYWGY